MRKLRLRAMKVMAERETCPLPRFMRGNKIMGDSIAMSSLLKEARETPQLETDSSISSGVHSLDAPTLSIGVA